MRLPTKELTEYPVMDREPFRRFRDNPTVANAADCIVAYVESNGDYPGNELYCLIHKAIYEGLVAATEENKRLRAALRTLRLAADRRENIMAGLCEYLEARAELRQACREAHNILHPKAKSVETVESEAENE